MKQFDWDAASFQRGFSFAMCVGHAIGQPMEIRKLAAYIIELCNGTAIMTPSPLDDIQRMEQNAGETLPEEVKTAIHRVLGSDFRRQQDEYNKQAAELIYRFLKQGGEDEHATH